MKKIVLTYGLISGVFFAVEFLITLGFADTIGHENGYVIGYTTMVAAFLLVYFGMRSYRDTVLNGVIKFGAAFRVGILITLLSSTMYVASWEIVSSKLAPDFAAKYAAHEIERAKAAGVSQEKLDAQVKKMKDFEVMYKNPFIFAGLTFLEVFPVGLVITLISAGVVSRRGRDGATANPIAV